MLIRISGHHDGIKDYLENGQKQDREFSRDEIDERVILAGDLDITNAIIQSIDTDAERYKTITLAFKEDEIEPATLQAIVRDFEAFAFAAYEPDEYCLYAEAHLPKIKSYTDRKTGEPVERKPHIHLVIPKVNLLSGQKLDPFAMVDHQAKFIDAFQEVVNHRYGLASPKDNRRVEFTSASEMISRYKGDAFAGGNRELKAAILEAMLARDITRYEDFRGLLQEFGEIRTRNARRETEYENVKPADAMKGANLKEYVFSRAFVELSIADKRAVLTRSTEPEYEIAGASRPIPEALQHTLREWHEVRAKEVKYFNGGNLSAYPFYRDAAPDERRQLLVEREQRFYQRFRGEADHEPGVGRSGHAEREQGRGDGVGARGLDATSVDDWSQSTGQLARESYGFKGDEIFVDRLAEADSSMRLATVKSLVSVEQLEFSDTPLQDSVARHPVTGREADTVLGQLARDIVESRAIRHDASHAEFQEIKRMLDADRLMAMLAHSHGVILGKYTITKGRDGGDRIQCGNRHLNVSDFLTKELKLPWVEAAQLMRDTYQAQIGRDALYVPRNAPAQLLWREFQAYRAEQSERNRVGWVEQGRHEQVRRSAIRSTFHAARRAIPADPGRSHTQRKAALSVARMTRVEQESALRLAIAAEREALKSITHQSLDDHYRAFLAQQAQTGDERALVELRRIRCIEPVLNPTHAAIRSAGQQEPNVIIWFCRINGPL